MLISSRRRFVGALSVMLSAVAFGACSSSSTTKPAPTKPADGATTTTAGTLQGRHVYEAACSRKLPRSSSSPMAAPEFTELSGIAASRSHPKVWYTHNDSGDSARFFAVNDNGAHLATFTVTGANAIDWEDIAVGPGPEAGTNYVYLADIGDNLSGRASVQVYRVAEPSIPTTNTTVALDGVDTLTLQYEGGPRDSESLLVDPRNGELTLIEKKLAGGDVGVYRAPADLADGSTTTMRKVSTVSLPILLIGAATGIDMSSDASAIALRTYGTVRVYALADPEQTSVEDALRSKACSFAVPREVQGEAVGFRADSSGLVTVAEGTKPVLRFFDAR